MDSLVCLKWGCMSYVSIVSHTADCSWLDPIFKKQCYVMLWTVANRNHQKTAPKKSISVKCTLYLEYFQGFRLLSDGPFQWRTDLKVNRFMLSLTPLDSIDKSGFFTSQNMGVAGPTAAFSAYT